MKDDTRKIADHLIAGHGVEGAFERVRDGITLAHDTRRAQRSGPLQRRPWVLLAAYINQLWHSERVSNDAYGARDTGFGKVCNLGCAAYYWGKKGLLRFECSLIVLYN